MIKNIVFDIGGVLAEEVNGRALTYLTAAEQEQLSDLVYFKSPGFIEVILGNDSSANYSAKMIERYPNLEKEISFLFDPKNLPITYPIKKQTLDLLYKLHDNYKIYFLSDMIDMSYDYLKGILQDFDGGAYSFQEHLKKPNPAFFETLLNRYHLDPTETIFFDDREKNVVAAQNLNMKAVIFTDVDSVLNALKG
ncbi:HAD-IA family hydrolase [Candidatus Saccharibacteria bacterium]|nr:HAD-IA family hydrolase [Candidatus Saccharibacteria bacterium]